MLQNHIMELKHPNLNMQHNLDNAEQYDRGFCLQIDGVTAKNNKSANS